MAAVAIPLPVTARREAGSYYNSECRQKTKEKALVGQCGDNNVDMPNDTEQYLCDYTGNGCMDKEELKLIIDATAKKTSKETLQEFMDTYGLTAAHWVWVDGEYKRAMSRQGVIRKTVITAIVVALCSVISYGLEMRLKEYVVTLLNHN